MGIEYRDVTNQSLNDGASQVLREAHDYFAGHQIGILGESFKEINGSQPLFEQYVEKISAMMPADMAADFAQLCENTRLATLQESMAGIQPITSLTYPILRRMWPRLGVMNALKHEVVKRPKFSISSMVPYIYDAQGNKHALPQALSEAADTDLISRKKLSTDAIDTPCNDVDLLTPAGGSKLNRDYIDVDFYITAVHMLPNAGDDVATAVKKEVSIELQSASGMLNAEIHADDGSLEDILFGKIDRENGLLTVTSLNQKIAKVEVEGYLSVENNNTSTDVTFDISYEDVDIGSGEQISASMTRQMMTDTMAMYNVDAAAKITDIMSQTLAQKLDLEGLKFLDRMHAKNKTDKSRTQYTSEFNVKPSPNYSGSPKDWREELKTVIDHVAETIKSDSYVTQGEFRIVGSAIDANLIPNADWTFNGSVDEQAGVAVDYSVGSYSGSSAYRVISTNNVKKGKLRMTYVPNQADVMTYKYYPYAFDVHQGDGYRNPNQPNVPGIIMNRRDTYKEVMPLYAEIAILGNDGRVAYQ